MKLLATLACILSVVICGLAADPKPKLKIKVAADGFPTGQDTPEGAACDLARSFIKRDVALFTNTCIRPFGGGQTLTNYQKFLEQTAQGIVEEAARKEEPSRGPKAIGKVFAARHLSRNGPASYGYAVFGFEDVMFVDVGAVLHGGKRILNRTLVIKRKGGKWYAHPSPDTDSLLSAGLNDEADSEQDFSDVYEVQK